MALNVFEPLKFNTQGINDLATRESLTVSDGKITVEIVEPTKSVSFAGGSFSEVEGKGIRWTDGRKSKSLVFKKSKLWADMSLSLTQEQEYLIDDTPVLGFSELGPTVIKSNLKQLGTLKNLTVSGDTTLAEFAFFSSDLNRIGINTDLPGAAIGLKENGVDVILGSLKQDTAVLGTTSNDNLEIITDNTARITVSNSGDVRVHGKLYVEELVTQRSSPLTFKENPDSSNYGKGMLWVSLEGKISRFLLQTGPHRIWSSEIIDIDDEKYFSIGRAPVLSKNVLGDTVIESSLQKLGVLRELQVAGDAAVTRTLSTNKISIGNFGISDHKLFGYNDISIDRNDTTELAIGSSITIGNPENYSRAVTVHGRLSVGVANPDPDVSLTVSGPVSFENKKFKVGSSAPTTGEYNKGDIVWNTDPKVNDFIGWVCINPGSPGYWLPFGVITSA